MKVMKDMEIKTENRYEYRKTQEKRKQMIAPDLFEFASKRCRKHWIRRWRNYESEQPNHKGIRTYETESDGFGASG